MPNFAYSGRTRAGQTVTGERIADTMDAAVALLRREQINVTRITPAAAKADPKADAKAKTGMIYPIAVIVIAGGVVGVILWKVIPTFAQLFSGLGADLPLPTRVVIFMSDNLVRYFPFLLVGAGAAGYGFKTYYATEN